MQRLIIWLRSWFIGRRLVAKLSAMEYRCQLAEENRQRSEEDLKDRLEQLIDLKGSMVVLSESLQVDIENSQKIHKQYEEGLASVRAELRVAKDVTIPSLTAAHKLLLQRIDAQTAIEVRRQVMAMPNPRDE